MLGKSRRANRTAAWERMAFRAQSIVADVALAALAFALAYLVAASRARGHSTSPMSPRSAWRN